MITFNLRCAEGHEFEGWFSSSEDYDGQRKRGLVACPLCGNGNVSKALMAPNVGAKSNSGPAAAPAQSSAPAGDPAPAGAHPQSHPTMQVSAPPDSGDGSGSGPVPDPEAFAAAYSALRKLQRKVVDECDYVGDRFAEEARKIHYGEADERGIYGQSSTEDAAKLREEGINVAAMPWLPPEN